MVHVTTELGLVSVHQGSLGHCVANPVPVVAMVGGAWARARVAMAESAITCRARVAVWEDGQVRTARCRVLLASLDLTVSRIVIVRMVAPATLWTESANANQASQATGKKTDIAFNSLMISLTIGVLRCVLKDILESIVTRPADVTMRTICVTPVWDACASPATMGPTAQCQYGCLTLV